MSTLNNITSDFIEVKKRYHELRMEQRNKISRFLDKNDGFEKKAACAGVKNYKSGKRLEHEYNLTDWQWICVTRNQVNFLISLQTFDRNPATQDLHILIDRIGIYAYVGEYSSKDAQDKMLITNFELPLDELALNELKKILIKLSECDLYRLQVQYQNICNSHGLVQI